MMDVRPASVVVVDWSIHEPSGNGCWPPLRVSGGVLRGRVRVDDLGPYRPGLDRVFLGLGSRPWERCFRVVGGGRAGAGRHRMWRSSPRRLATQSAGLGMARGSDDA